MTPRWHPDALADAAAAARFYRDQRPGIAERFLTGLEDSLRRIHLHPKIYREIEPGIRKCQLDRFPYAVIFRDGPTLQILAVMHTRRQPDYWKQRV